MIAIAACGPAAVAARGGAAIARRAAHPARALLAAAALAAAIPAWTFAPPAALAAAPAAVAEAFRAGNERYQASDFESAAQAYREALSHGYDAAALRYNLGNAELKRGRIGGAILEYRRALRLDPRHDDARANLEYARSLAMDVPPPAGDPALLRLLLAAEGAVPPTAALRLAAAGYWLAAAMVILAWIAPARRRIARGALAAALALLLCGLVFALLGSLRDRAGSEGVVLEREVAVRTGPDAASTVLFTLHEGAEVEVHRRAEGWVEVRISDELRGWVAAAALGLL